MEHYQKTSKINKFAKKQAVALWGTMGHYQKTQKNQNCKTAKTSCGTMGHYGTLWSTIKTHQKPTNLQKTSRGTMGHYGALYKNINKHKNCKN
jgi:hypothetical protein